MTKDELAAHREYILGQQAACQAQWLGETLSRGMLREAGVSSVLAAWGKQTRADRSDPVMLSAGAPEDGLVAVSASQELEFSVSR